ncbi:MAG: DNA repair protein RecN [Candidatus Aminicenantes bacterium]|nr:DNA repair protein RecN [Candidatus Aminicenantes bacterium]
MLRTLRIKNLATIEEIELNLKKGLTILTGETGAGKSIIIDGIRLIQGEKGSPDMIRTGEAQLSVEAIFAGTARSSVSEETSETFFQRILSNRGSGRGYVNGTLVPTKLMQENGDLLVDIYGQNDHAFLRKKENQLDYLDAYSEALDLRRETARVAQDTRKLIREKTELEAREKEREQRLDFLRYIIHEIEEADLKPDEEETLHQERNFLKNVEKIQHLISEALQLAYMQDTSISPQLSKLQGLVLALSEFDFSLKEMLSSLDSFAIGIRELSDHLIRMQSRDGESTEDLERVEERLSLIEKLKRKYGKSAKDILAFLNKSREEYETLTTSSEKLEELGAAINKSFVLYREKAKALWAARRNGAARLEKDIENEIGFLGMQKARVRIDLQSTLSELTLNDKIRDTGTEEVEFLISPNPGEDPKPLRKIASGGELSRIMLAIKSIGREQERERTLIFDEIDSGIGGKIADFVARKLQKLAASHQVLCITHLPQIASFARTHIKIEKQIVGDRTFTTVSELNFEERVEEVARMMSGSRVTESGLRTARELLERNSGTVLNPDPGMKGFVQ